jgi:Fe-S cluster assembly protein SufD
MKAVPNDTLTARIAGLSFAPGGWAGTARNDALARLTVMGLPVRRDEYWRYTDPASLTQAAAPVAAVFRADDELPVFDAIDRLKIVFVDGVFDAAQSDDLTLAGVTIERLAVTADIHWARDVYGVLEKRGQTPVARPLAALNTAC